MDPQLSFHSPTARRTMGDFGSNSGRTAEAEISRTRLQQASRQADREIKSSDVILDLTYQPTPRQALDNLNPTVRPLWRSKTTEQGCERQVGPWLSITNLGQTRKERRGMLPPCSILIRILTFCLLFVLEKNPKIECSRISHLSQLVHSFHSYQTCVRAIQPCS